MPRGMTGPVGLLDTRHAEARAFAYDGCAIRFHAFESIDMPAWPGSLDSVDRVAVAESEMQARVMRGVEASTSRALRNLDESA